MEKEWDAGMATSTCSTGFGEVSACMIMAFTWIYVADHAGSGTTIGGGDDERYGGVPMSESSLLFLTEMISGGGRRVLARWR